MWYSCFPIENETLKRFESVFNFTINEPLRDFLLAYNAGRTRFCSVVTNTKERRIAALLDFSSSGDAYEVNRRMRKILGEKCIVIGIDRSDNYLCVRRNMRNQEFVIWNHITAALEESITDIPVTLMKWQAATERSS